MAKIKVTKKMTEYILKNDPICANSDEVLFANILRHYNIYIRDIDVVKTANAISRRRRRFNQNGLYLPTDLKIAKRRKMLDRVYADKFRTTKIEVQSSVLVSLP